MKLQQILQALLKAKKSRDTLYTNEFSKGNSVDISLIVTKIDQLDVDIGYIFDSLISTIEELLNTSTNTNTKVK